MINLCFRSPFEGHPVKVYTYDEWTMRLGKLHASIGLQRLGLAA